MAEITITNLHAGYGDKPVLSNINVHIPHQHITTIIGPNGCGKSTLLKTMANLMPRLSGTVTINGTDTTTFRRRQLATTLGVLPQSPSAPGGITVAELVSRGRHPHQSWLTQWSAGDEKIVKEALSLTGINDLAQRPVSSLSGGQRQRVWIAMVLAQETETIFLDEPTTFLDLAASIEILQLVQKLRTELGRTIVMVLHDLNLAIRHSDNLVVMKSGQIQITGTPAEVITADLLQQTFGLNALLIKDPITDDPLIVPKD